MTPRADKVKEWLRDKDLERRLLEQTELSSMRESGLTTS